MPQLVTARVTVGPCAVVGVLSLTHHHRTTAPPHHRTTAPRRYTRSTLTLGRRQTGQCCVTVRRPRPYLPTYRTTMRSRVQGGWRSGEAPCCTLREVGACFHADVRSAPDDVTACKGHGGTAGSRSVQTVWMTWCTCTAAKCTSYTASMYCRVPVGCTRPCVLARCANSPAGVHECSTCVLAWECRWLAE